MTDKQLVDWLARRAYVEATDAGYEDPGRFTFYGGDRREQGYDGFRAALTRHIERLKQRRRRRPAPPAADA